MKIKTKNGEAEGMPLSDIQENNKRIRELTISFAVVSGLAFGYLVWLTIYIINNNVLNNIVARCIG